MKAITPTAANVAVTSQVKEEPSCCSDLLQRVQAIWDCFLTLIATLVDWCAIQIHGPTGRSKPLEIDFNDRFSRMHYILPRHLLPKTAEEKAKETLVKLVEAFDGMTAHSRFLLRRIPDYLPLEDRAKQIQAAIDDENILCKVANTQQTMTEAFAGPSLLVNKTRLLLQLGANPNKADAWGYVPLHFAVLSGCQQAYEDLRKAGGNPWRDNYHYESGQTPLEIAYHIIRAKQPLGDYFWQIDQGKSKHLLSYFPHDYFARSSYSQPPGSLADVQKIVDFDVEKVTDPIQAGQPVYLDRPVAKIIAQYYLTGDPNECGANLVNLYKSFYSSLDPNTKGVQEQLNAKPELSVTEQLALIQKSVQTSNELFLAVNPNKTDEWHNRTELFLLLGANPNKRATLGKLENFTPLHAAVLTRCPLAYKTLRAQGADPTLRLGTAQDGDTCIELAEKMLKARGEKNEHEYFREFVLAAGIQKKEMPGQDPYFGYDLLLFPCHYEHSLDENKKVFGNAFGTAKDLQEILDYERMLQNPIAQAIHKHYELPEAMAMLAAGYAKE